MSNYRLQHPVSTIDNKLLLDSGTTLSSEAMESLISECKSLLVTDSMLKYRDLKQDILSFLKHGPYQTIFANPEKRSEIIKIMEGANLPLPVLESIYYFKRYDSYTYRHILMVFALSTLLSKMLITDKMDMVQEVIAGPTHDIGKTCVPLEVLLKKDPLTTKERNMLEHHSLAGYVLLSYYFQDVQNHSARVARDHHERKDGSGYPSGIRLNDPLVDIIMITDIYDALISQRPYRSAPYDNRTALEEITKMVNENKVNMETVQALIAVNRSGGKHYSDCIISQEKRGTAPVENNYGIIDDEGKAD